jgi:carbon-monoxide dehydrogenase medium subunit
MKAPAFDYVKPRSLDQVFALLAEYGDEARLLAGGQTLLATLNMRLSEPSLLIDINQIESLKGIRLVDGTLRIGALARHVDIEASPLVAQHAPLMASAAPHIAHRAIRNLGTFGGSLAYADPAAEWPACALALDATIVARSADGERRIPAAEFFLDLYTTSLRAGEIIVACDIPLCGQHGIQGFDELARRHGDYAIVGLAFAAQRTGAALKQIRLSFLGLGSTPLRPIATEQMLEGQAIDATLLDAAAARLAQELTGALEPLADLTNSAATKRHLATVLMRRVVQAACIGAGTGAAVTAPAQ